VFSAAADGVFEIVTFLLPSGAASRVQEVEAAGGRGFEVHSEQSRDLLVVKDTGEYTWLRTPASGEAPEEISFSSTDSA
jgi:hypothetical protein